MIYTCWKQMTEALQNYCPNRSMLLIVSDRFVAILFKYLSETQQTSAIAADGETEKPSREKCRQGKQARLFWQRW
jgi:hypothetical protein